MKDDITRETFRPFKHFSRVLMQQGRVQIDADWNEQVAIHHHYLRSLAADVIGPFGMPLHNDGFKPISLPVTGAATPKTADFLLSEGHAYVDGILCEIAVQPVPATASSANGVQTVVVSRWMPDGVAYAPGQYVYATSGDIGKALLITNVDASKRSLTVAGPTALPAEPFLLKRAVTYSTQPDLAPAALQTNTAYHVYLDVWERLVTYAEDDSIREVALNGPDTAARAKVVWQVKLLETDGNNACIMRQALRDRFQPANLARLKARAQPERTSDDPCTIAPDALYRGPENQLYRVEVHTGNDTDPQTGERTQPTFKWSRENGSVVFPIRSGGGTKTLILETLGHDDRFGLAAGDWVEVCDDAAALGNAVRPLLQVQSIDRSRLTVVLSGSPDANIGKDLAKHPLLRRWDHQKGDPAAGGLTLGPDNAAEVPEGEPDPDSWLDLEDGVQVQFSDPGTTIYRPGDYWLIPARVATGDVEWPSETYSVGQGKSVSDKVALPPIGVVHHYAPLAVVTINTADNTLDLLQSCMPTFSDLVDLSSFRLNQFEVQQAKEDVAEVKRAPAAPKALKAPRAARAVTPPPLPAPEKP
ncbi:MAG: hypothetical protein JOZ72_07265 [Alphaproteobacteria bacterium]|nr:hypothetical protein [Alphaproteobacteria bacterium]